MECPICFDSFESSDMFVSKCSHQWCKTCCVKIDGNRCPLCRKVFRKAKPAKRMPIYAPMNETDCTIV